MDRPIDQVKLHLRKLLLDSYHQLHGKVSKEDWNEFELFFWNIRRYLDIDYPEKKKSATDIRRV